MKRKLRTTLTPVAERKTQTTTKLWINQKTISTNSTNSITKWQFISTRCNFVRHQMVVINLLTSNIDEFQMEYSQLDLHFLLRIHNFADLHVNFHWKYVMKTRFGSRFKSENWLFYWRNLCATAWMIYDNCKWLFCLSNELCEKKNVSKVRSLHWKLFRCMNTKTHENAFCCQWRQSNSHGSAMRTIYVSWFSSEVFRCKQTS